MHWGLSPGPGEIIFRSWNMKKESKNHYLDLELSLYSLRVHYDMCKGATNEEVLEWARFFCNWCRAAVKYCGIWSLENQKNAENFVKNLEKSKVGVMGYEVLERLMGEANVNLNREIIQSLKPTDKTKEPATAKA
jgi:hypothetical protein